MRRDTVPDWLDYKDGLRFDLHDAASGYQLWIELGLCEALARIRALNHVLYYGGRLLRIAYDDEVRTRSTTSRTRSGPVCCPKYQACAST